MTASIEIDRSVTTAHELVMKWADIYAAQTGNLYAEAARHPSRTARMASVRADLSRVVAEVLAVLPPPPASADDARDAARYRWLRDEHIGDDPCSISLSSATSGLDAVIDARMAE